MRARAIVLLSVLLAAAGCRKSETSASSGQALVPSTEGAHGCVGPDQGFSGACAPCVQPLATGLTFSAASQIVASATGSVLYATAQEGVVQIDVAPPVPVVTVLADAAAVDAFVLALGGVLPLQLSGIAVLPGPLYVVAELTNNFLFAVDGANANALVPFAGQPSPVPGFADGPAVAGPPFARFHFDVPIQLAATGGPSPRVVIPDPGNHAIREWLCTGSSCPLAGFVTTLAGTGSPFFRDDDLVTSGFDTPVGATLTCSGSVLVPETGAAGVAGHRLRQILLTEDPFFGAVGAVTTYVGDGSAVTAAGDGEAASTAAPVGVFATSASDVYWVDSLTGVFRRARGSNRSADCPLFADCGSAVAAGGTFTAGGRQSVTGTVGGRLFVLDWDPAAGLGTLFELSP